jgi:hypothetical protein
MNAQEEDKDKEDKEKEKPPSTNGEETNNNGEKQRRFPLPESRRQQTKDERFTKTEILLPIVREAVQRPERI